MKAGKTELREELFCSEYLVDLNGTAAAIRAGYAKKGAHVEASRLLSKPKVKARIAKLMRERAARTLATADEVLLELKRLAFFNLRDAFGKDGALKSLRKMRKDVSACISSVEQEELFAGKGQERMAIGQVRKVKAHDKLKALELLGKNLKLWTDKVEHSGALTLEELVLASNGPPPKEKG